MPTSKKHPAVAATHGNGLREFLKAKKKADESKGILETAYQDYKRRELEALEKFGVIVLDVEQDGITHRIRQTHVSRKTERVPDAVIERCRKKGTLIIGKTEYDSIKTTKVQGAKK